MENELALINKVDLRIALASTDAQLESSLKLYLAPLLLKLCLPHQQVKNAVLKIVQNIITRLNAAPTIRLPVEALLAQSKVPNIPEGLDSTYTRSYSLLFVVKGIDRMSTDERRDVLPLVIHDIHSFPDYVGARLFNVFVKVISGWKAPEFDTMEYHRLIKDLDFDANKKDELFLADKIGKFFLLLPSNAQVVTKNPGLNADDVKYFTTLAGTSYSKLQDIEKVRCDLFEFLKVGFTPQLMQIPLLLASSATGSSINDKAELLYRKMNVDVEDAVFVDTLIDLFIGNDVTSSVRPELQDKILTLLTKSTAATMNPKISKLTDKGLNSEYPRLKQTTIQFIKWISVNNYSEEVAKSMTEFNTNMAHRLRDSIMAEGWPKVMATGLAYNTAISSRQSQYETLGNILKSTPELFLNDFFFIEFLFDSLEGESPELRPIIQEGLSSLTVFLPKCSPDVKQNIKSLGEKYFKPDVNDSIHNCRFTILKYVNCTFPFEDCVARYLNILGTSKLNKPETIEEGTKGLHPHWFNIIQSSNTNEFKSTLELLGQRTTVEFPPFNELVDLINEKVEQAYDSMYASDELIFKSIGKAIEFSIQTLVTKAVKNKKTVVVVDEDWSVRLEKALEVDSYVRNLLKEEITKNESFKKLLVIIFNAFDQQWDRGQDITYESTLCNLVSLLSSEIVGSLIDLNGKLLKILGDRPLGDISVSQISRVIGVIASHPNNASSDLVSLITGLIDSEIPVNKYKVNAIVLSYLLSRITYRDRLDIIQKINLKKYLDKLLVCLQDSSCYYQALEAIGQLSLYGIMGPTLKLVDSDYITKILEVVKPKVKKSDERSVIVLSYLNFALPTTDSSELTEIEQLVYETHISKQTEYLFTSGEAFSILAIGWDSKVLTRAIDIADGSIKYVLPYDRLKQLLDMILKSCANTKPSLRRAGCIWLLSIVEFCKEKPLIKEQSSRIHLTFMKFLGDRDELVQEAASRGLSLIYELGDVELKDNLVKGLLKSFTDSGSTSSSISGTVDQDTELFDSDILRTHDGSVSTYRDVLNLASDVGDPSLVYKFMSLAKSSALWSSRKGMAFGLGSILSKTSLDEMLTKNKTLANRLIPKLYRYKFDPITSVSAAMQEIWNVLVDDSSKTIQSYFKDILDELLKSMGNKEWRVRQASTTALIDLLNVVEFDKVEPHLPDIWTMSFRVMDDIKESVRKEGNKVTKLLAKLLINNKQGKGLEKLIPFLLGNKGLLSDAEDIRTFALDTIVKLIENKSVKSYVPQLLENFVVLMSTLEPEVINYLVLNADKYNLKNNDIDAKRLQSLGHSPIMDSIEKLIDEFDYEIMDRCVTAVINSIKSSVGLPSKVCGSKVLVSLVNRKYELTKPYGDKLFKIAMNQIKDKNDTIASSYAISVGYLSRLASIDTIILYGKRLKTMYFESEDNERQRLIASIASESFSKYSNEKFELVASEFLPLTFIGMNDIDKNISKNFEKQWIENTSGSNVIKLYLNEIIDLMSQYIKSQNYQIRQILAKSVVKLTNDISDFSNLPSDLTTKMFDILIESCKGKSWSGKEMILEALVSYCIKVKHLVTDDLLQQTNKVVLTEAKRKNKEYQKHSIKLMGKYLYYFPDESLTETYVEIMSQIVGDKYEDSDDEDDQPKVKRNNTNNKLEEQKISYITNLFEAFTSKKPNQQLFSLMVNSMITLLSDDNDFEVTWRSKVCGNEMFIKLVDELDQEFGVQQLLQLWDKLYQTCSSISNIENVKIKFIRSSKLFIKYLEEYHYLEDVSKIQDSFRVFDDDSTIIKAEIMK